MFGGNFQTWKLHSAQDYFMFFAYILAGVLVFWLIAKHMNKQRNHEKAVEKVSGRRNTGRSNVAARRRKEKRRV